MYYFSIRGLSFANIIMKYFESVSELVFIFKKINFIRIFFLGENHSPCLICGCDLELNPKPKIVGAYWVAFYYKCKIICFQVYHLKKITRSFGVSVFIH